MFTLQTAIFTLQTGTARAGNFDGYYLSGEAALQGGAITADTRHGGAIWYNPAGLANQRYTRLDASVSAYVLHLGREPDLSTTSSNTHAVHLRSIDFRVVPSALAHVRRFGGVTVGFGVFAPVVDQTFLRLQLQRGTSANGVATASPEVGLDIYSRTQDYYAGPSAGFSLSPGVNFGASVFVHYRSSLTMGDAEFSATKDGESAAVISHSTLEWYQLGVQSVLGLQLAPNPEWNIGFAVRLPSLRVYQVRQSVSVISLGTAESEAAQHYSQQAEFRDDSGFAAGMILPMRFHAGASRRLGRGRLAVDLSYTEPFRNASLNLDWKPTINARIGGKYSIGDDAAIGAGLFSDRSPERQARSFGATRFDYYGITLCLDLGTVYQLRRDRALHAASEPPRLRLGTTVALSYAIGFGEVVGAAVDFDRGLGVTEVPNSTLAHELSFQLASSLTM